MERKITLSEKEIPDKWYNVVTDIPNKPLPPLNRNYGTDRAETLSFVSCRAD